jgi:hypothetical protein
LKYKVAKSGVNGKADSTIMGPYWVNTVGKPTSAYIVNSDSPEALKDLPVTLNSLKTSLESFKLEELKFHYFTKLGSKRFTEPSSIARLLWQVQPQSHPKVDWTFTLT